MISVSTGLCLLLFVAARLLGTVPAMPVLSPHLKIIAAGRGKTMSLPATVDTVLSMLPKRARYKFVYLGTATYDRDHPFHAQTRAYQKHEKFDIIRLNVSEAVLDADLPSLDGMRRTLDDADVLLVSGGNTRNAMNRWKRIGLDKLLVEAAHRTERTPVLCGGSAGAIVWFSHGHSDSLDPTTEFQPDPNLTKDQKKDWKYIRVEGLRVIDADVLCVPHYDATQSNGRPRSEDSDGMLKRECDPDKFVSVGIDETAALVVQDGRVRVLSAKGKAHVHVLRSDGSAGIAHKHIRPEDGSQTWEEFVSFDDGECKAQDPKERGREKAY